MKLYDNLVSVQKNTDINAGTITWNLSRRCNYDCSYCSNSFHDSNSPLLSKGDLDTALHHFSQLDVSSLRLSLSGGEPFLHKSLTNFLGKLRDTVNFPIRIGATTNGSLPSRAYIEAVNVMNFLTFSAHIEFIKHDIFLNKVREVNENIRDDFSLKVNLMFLPGHFKEVSRLWEQLQSLNIPTVIRKIRKKDSAEFLFYSEFDLNFISESFDQKSQLEIDIEVELKSEEHPVRIKSDKIVSCGANSFLGWECMAGSRHFTIWYDGSVYPCEPVKGIESLGNFFHDNFQWPSPSPIICPKQKCICLGDILIPKWKSG